MLAQSVASLPDASHRVYGLAPGAILASHDQDAGGNQHVACHEPAETQDAAQDEIADAMLFLATGAI